MILEFGWNRCLLNFVAWSRGPKKRSGGGCPNLTFAVRVSPKYLSNETKIYIFISRIPRVVYIIFLGFFPNFIFPTSGRYLQTSALKHPALLPKKGHLTDLIVRHFQQRRGDQGRARTHAEIRLSGIWIVDGSSIVSHHISKCVTCRKLRAASQQ